MNARLKGHFDLYISTALFNAIACQTPQTTKCTYIHTLQLALAYTSTMHCASTFYSWLVVQSHVLSYTDLKERPSKYNKKSVNFNNLVCFFLSFTRKQYSLNVILVHKSKWKRKVIAVNIWQNQFSSSDIKIHKHTHTFPARNSPTTITLNTIKPVNLCQHELRS